jgi:FAD/FMN-containing dehydrogenase
VYFAVYSVWENEAEDTNCLQWVKEQIKRIEPVTAGQYLGDSDFTADQRKFMSEENWVKLQEIRKKYDPESLFHSYLSNSTADLNKNIWNRQLSNL